MTRLHYPASRLWPDYLRALLGLSICAGPLLFASPQSVIFAVLAALCLLFAWLAANTVWRQQIEIELDTTGVTQTARWLSGWRRVVPWSTLSAVSLRYYSTRRDRSEGWMQLTIRGHGGSVRVESSLTGFPLLARQALAAADRAGLAVSESTRTNAARLPTGPESGL